jgi:hypothetical protein
MSIAQNDRNFAEIFKAAASERVKPGAILISPWQVDANQESLDRGLEDCGCAFAPDEPEEKRL